MFLPSLLGKEDDRQSGSSGGTGTGTHDAAAFTCTPGEMGLIQRLPLSYRIPPGKAVPLPLLPIPYLLPGERPGDGGRGITHVLYVSAIRPLPMRAREDRARSEKY